MLRLAGTARATGLRIITPGALAGLIVNREGPIDSAV
jgi:hypothetical protein